MARTPHAKTPPMDHLTEMQQIVVRELRRGLSWTAAARAAGYADPSGEVNRLKANVGIIDAVIGPLQASAASWSMLGEKARQVLDRNMDEGHSDWCRSLQPPDPEHGYADCNCWFAKIRAADANAAARIVTDVLGRSDPKTLAAKASDEDKGISDEEAARAYLGVGKESEEDGTTH